MPKCLHFGSGSCIKNSFLNAYNFGTRGPTKVRLSKIRLSSSSPEPASTATIPHVIQQPVSATHLETYISSDHTPEIPPFFDVRCGCCNTTKKLWLPFAITEPQIPMIRCADRFQYYVKKKQPNHSFEVRKTCSTCEKLSYISLGVLPVVFCDIWQYFVKMCKKNIKKCKTSVKTILHQKGAVAIFFRYLGKKCGICGSVLTAVLGISRLVAMLTNN